MNQLIYQTITDKRAIPFNSAGQGTISTAGLAINGLGTSFSTQMQVGSYLVNLTTNEVIKVFRVNSDTQAYLEKPFLADLYDVTPQIVKWFQIKVKLIALSPSGTVLLNGQPLTQSIEISCKGNSRASRADLIEPVIVDASGGSCIVEIVNY